MPEFTSQPIPSLSERLLQIVKVEEPISLTDVRRLCRDVPVAQVDQSLLRMAAAGWLRVKREWPGNQLVEVYSYADPS